eukprot:763658-Hanusia_phi.AAC.6
MSMSGSSRSRTLKTSSAWKNTLNLRCDSCIPRTKLYFARASLPAAQEPEHANCLSDSNQTHQPYLAYVHDSQSPVHSLSSSS